MFKKYKAYVVASYGVAILGVSGAGAYLGYRFWQNTHQLNLPPSEQVIQADHVPVYASQQPTQLTETRLASGATILYRQHDRRTQTTTERVETIPAFLVNRTQAHIEATFTTWQVTSFSETALVLEQTIESLPMVAYTLSVSDNHIAIFRGQMSHNDLLEVTTIPVDHLPVVEIERLERGIALMDRHELIRRLEDFST